MIEWVKIECSYCSASFETRVDLSAGEHQEYVEDCQICCQPILFQVLISGEGELLELATRAEND